MKILLSILICALIPAINASAATVCSGALLSFQEDGLQKFFSPSQNAGLSFDGGGPVGLARMSKRLSKAEVAQLEASSPRVRDKVSLSVDRAKLLKGWLNSNASAAIPGWFSTAISAVVPSAWVGISVDLAVQFANGQGDAGRLAASNLAGVVSAGGQLAAIEQVRSDKDGKKRYLFAIVYSYELNKRTQVSPLSWCISDLISP